MIGKAALILALAIAVIVPLQLVMKLGIFKSFYKHHPGICREVKGIQPGSEDMAVTSSGLVFITSGLIVLGAKQDSVIGKIYLFDFNATDQRAVELKVKTHPGFEPSEFHPHGLSVLEDSTEKGEHLLYVISHPNESADHVIKFRFLPKGKELEFVKTFSSDKFFVTNDLAVLKEDVFYVTNYLHFRSPALQAAEILLGLAVGGVLLHNGTEATEVSTSVSGANGIALSKDGRFVYVNSNSKESLLVFERRADNWLELVQTVRVDTGVDNLHLSSSGDGLYIGAHPINWKAIRYFQDPSNQQSPSSVLHVPLADGKARSSDIVEVFYDHGDLISGSSVAASYNDQLLIGSVLDKLVLCQLNNSI